MNSAKSNYGIQDGQGGDAYALRHLPISTRTSARRWDQGLGQGAQPGNKK